MTLRLLLCIALVCISRVGIASAKDSAPENQSRDRVVHRVHTATALDCVLLAQGPAREAGELSCAELLLQAANSRRGEYEYGELPRQQRRALGRELDLVAQHAIARLAALPDSSERFRLEADLVSAMLRSRFKAIKLHKTLAAATARALELNPDNPRALLTAAKRPLFAPSEHGGDLTLALEYLDRACALAPNFAHAWLYRGIAMHKLGKSAAADTDWQRAFQLDESLELERDRLLAVDTYSSDS